MSKYKILKELINEWIEREKEDLAECKDHGGYNTVGAGMAMGALEAYRQVLTDISQLERTAVIDDSSSN